MKKKTLSNHLFAALEQLGLTRVFLVPGGGNMFLVDAAGTQNNIDVVPVHHEQAAVIAAEYYSRISGKLGVAVVTTGPGCTNAVTGIAGAYFDSVPILILAGQVKTSDYNFGGILRQSGPQEIDFVSMVEKITKVSKTCFDADECLEDLIEAARIAMQGRPGPVVLEIPLDVQSAIVTKGKAERLLSHAHKCQSDEKRYIDLQEITNLLVANFANAERPLIIAGNGVKAAGITRELRNLLKNHNLPVSLTWPTIDILPFAHDLNAGRFGNVAKRYANILIQRSDYILVLGCRLDPVLTAYNLDRFGKNAKVFVVDIDNAELSKLPGRFTKLNYDVKSLVPALNQSLCEAEGFFVDQKWHDEIKRLKNLFGSEVFCFKKNTGIELSVYEFVERLSHCFDGGETIITGSSGLGIEVFYAHFKNKENQRISLTTGLGAMGYGVPALLGASEAVKGKTYLIESDGSLMMNLQELQSIKSRSNQIVIFILNNNGYASIRATQLNYFEGRLVGTGNSSGLEIPEIEKIANCFGFDYLRLDQSCALNKTIKRAVEWQGQLICEVVLKSDEPLLPKCGVFRKADNSLVSAPLEDMNPLLQIAEQRSIMGESFDEISVKIRE